MTSHFVLYFDAHDYVTIKHTIKFCVCRVISEVKSVYDPQVIVCQCGADGLSEDPMNSFNLTLHGIKECVRRLLAWKLPILLLGGGEIKLPSFTNIAFLASIGHSGFQFLSPWAEISP